MKKYTKEEVAELIRDYENNYAQTIGTEPFLIKMGIIREPCDCCERNPCGCFKISIDSIKYDRGEIVVVINGETYLRHDISK